MKVIWILSELFLLIYSNSNKSQRCRFLRRSLFTTLTVCYNLKFMISKAYIMIIYHWKNWNRPWYFYRIWNSSDRAFYIFLFHFFPFYQIPHPAIVFHCNFLTMEIYWNFTKSFRFSVVSQLQPNFIIKALYWQFSPKIQTWLYYPTILKVPWHKSCIKLL